MRTWRIALVASALGLAVAACGGSEVAQEDGADATADEALGSTDAADGVAPAEDGTPSDTPTSDTPDAASSPTPSATTAAATTAAAKQTNDLTAYIGKFPFEEVGGVTWDNHPVVLAGIRSTVKDAAARRAIISVEGPSAPIGTYQGKVGAWSCEQHNCGDHQWAVLVDAKSGATDVCYHNAAQTAGNSRWFLANGREETRPGDCSVV